MEEKERHGPGGTRKERGGVFVPYVVYGRVVLKDSMDTSTSVIKVRR